MELLSFVPIALASIVLALMVVLNKSPIGSAVSLIGMMLCLAAIFALQSAHFLAILQVIVYAGAIMVLFMFVIMLLNLKSEDLGGKTREGNTVLTGVAAVLVLAVLVKIVCVTLNIGFGTTAETSPDFGTTAKVGAVLFTDYVLPFEVASILLLVAMIGALVLAKSKVD